MSTTKLRAVLVDKVPNLSWEVINEQNKTILVGCATRYLAREIRRYLKDNFGGDYKVIKGE